MPAHLDFARYERILELTELRDRDLVRLYWPVELRPAFDALFAIDDAMAEVVEKATDPTLAAIKLAWWRERLEGLDAGQVPAEPRLQAAAAELLTRGISGSDLAQIERGWAVWLQAKPDPWLAEDRGEALFKVMGQLLRATHALLLPAGRIFAGVDYARRHSSALERSRVVMGGVIFPSVLRPATALAALAVRDIGRGGPPFEPEATPGRAMTLFRHRWTGYIS